MPPQTYIFTLTTGRTGTRFLTDTFRANFPSATTYHEMLGFNNFGVDTPDISHLTIFNSQGNTPYIQKFWRHKLNRINQSPSTIYVETSHILMKAGLIENLSLFPSNSSIHLIALTRPILQIATSFSNRFTFFNYGSRWLWGLDPNYPKNIVASQPFLDKIGEIQGATIWYVCEILSRIEYYRLKLASSPHITIHSLKTSHLNQATKINRLFHHLHLKPPPQLHLPLPSNQGPKTSSLPPSFFRIYKSFLKHLVFDPQQLAQTYINNGGSFD